MRSVLYMLLALAVTANLVVARTNTPSPPPGPGPCTDECNCPEDEEGQAPPPISSGPVHYNSGNAYENATDLSVPGVTFGWRHTRSYNSGLQSDTAGEDPYTMNGRNWMTNGTETSLRQVGTDVHLVVNAQSKRIFTESGGSYTAPVGYSATLTKDTFTDSDDIDSDTNTTEEMDRFTLTETSSGTVLVFTGFDADIPLTLRGKLLEKTNREFQEEQPPIGGVEYSYTKLTDGTYLLGQITTSQDLNIVYTWKTSDVISKIEVKTSGGTVLQKAEYKYYEDVSTNTDLGSTGDLVQVKVSKLASVGTNWIVRHTQYRYYLDGGMDAGEASQIKMVLESDAIDRINSAGNPLVNTPDEILGKADGYVVANGNGVDKYASRSFTYYTAPLDTSVAVTPWGSQNLQTKYGGANFDETGYVETETINGSCGGCGGGPAGGGLMRTYFYLDLNRDINGDPASTDANEVTRITIEDTEDASGGEAYRKVFGINQYSRLLREALIEDPTLSTQTIWCKSTILDSNRRTSEEREPSAHASDSDADMAKFLDPYDASGPSWANDIDAGVLRDTAGVIYTHEYDTNGYRIGKTVKKGNTDTSNPKYYVYGAKYGGTGVADHIMTERYEYPDAQTTRTGGTVNTTTYTYTFWDTNNSVTKKKKTSLPVIATGQNGSGVAITNEEYYDWLGRLRWIKDGEGNITYRSYHPETGGLAYVMRDVETDDLHTDITSGSSGNWLAWDADPDTPGNQSTIPSGFANTDNDNIQLVSNSYFDDQGRLTKTTEAGGGVHYTVYEANRTLVFPYFNSTNGDPDLPIRVTAFNDGGQTTETYTVKPAKTAPTGTPSAPTGLQTITQSDYLSWTRYTYNALAGQREYVDRYHDIPSSDDGDPSINHNRAVTQYDDLGRRQYIIEVVSGDESTGVEQVTKFSYDVRDRVTMLERGVSPSGSGANDMGSTYSTNYPTLAKITELEYDGGGIGDSRATKTKRYHGTGANDWTGENRYYTHRGHLRGIESIYYSAGEQTTGPYTVLDTDWLGRTVATAQFSATTSFGTAWATVIDDDDYAENATDGNRLSLDTTLYDDIGRVYATELYAVNSSGTKGNKLVTNSYYDRNSRPIASAVAGNGGTELAYDGAGRQYQTRTVTALETTLLYNATTGAFIYRDPQPKPGIDDGTPGSNKTNMTIGSGNDKVIALNHRELDDSGNMIRSIHWAAYHGDTDGLEAEAVTKDYVQTSVYFWYDDADRLTGVANYGTNNADYTAAVLHDLDPTAPSSSSTVLVTSYAYDDENQVTTITDPEDNATKTETDDLGRATRVKEADGQTEKRWTITQYDGLSNVVKLIADVDNDDTYSGGVWTDPSTADDQVTEYTYGDVYNASRVTTIEYPDSQDANDVVTIAYNLDGTIKTREDQRDTVITFGYDDNRRMDEQDLTTVGSADPSTGKIAYTYDDLGRRAKVTSYDNGTPSVINEIQYAYTDYGALATEYQNHGGSVSTTTSPRVDYLYDETAGAGANDPYTKALRLKAIVYPASTDTDLSDLTKRRDINYNYATGISDDISRVSEVRDDDSSDLASYTYLGDGSVVKVAYDEPSVELDYIDGTTAPYKGFDRFGRVVDHKWYDTLALADRDRIKYGHDRNSNRLWRESNLTTTNDDNEDELYTYDKLNRLTNLKRGNLNGTQDGITSGAEKFAQDWGLDDLGNWSTFKQDDNGNGASWELEQSRVHNKVNEIDTDEDHANAKGASITATTGTNWFDPVYDAAGNMTEMPSAIDSQTIGATNTYDAWNRLVKVFHQALQDTVATYEYDGLGRRIIKNVYDVNGNPGQDRHYYHTVNWQVVEERIDSATKADRQYVWGLRYVDDLILRDRDDDNNSTTGNLGVTGSGLDERLYSLQDANFNVTTITDTGGDAVERYRYTPYGERTILDASFTVRTSSNYGWEVGHQGLIYDTESGLIYNRARYLHPKLGRFMQRDIFEYIDGINFYEYERSRPIFYVDARGDWVHIAIGAGIGGTVGAITGGIKGGWKGALKGGAAGAVGGAVTAGTFGLASGAAAALGAGSASGLLGGAASGTLGGAAGAAASEGIDAATGGSFDPSEVGKGALAGGLGGAIGGAAAGASAAGALSGAETGAIGATCTIVSDTVETAYEELGTGP